MTILSTVGKEAKPILKSTWGIVKDSFTAGRKVAVGVVESPTFTKAAVIGASGIVIGTGFYAGSRIAGAGIEKLSESGNRSLANLGFNVPNLDANIKGTSTYSAAASTNPTNMSGNKQANDSLIPSQNVSSGSGFFSFGNISTVLLVIVVGILAYKYMKSRK